MGNLIVPTEPTVLCEISQSRRSDVTWGFHVRGDWGGGYSTRTTAVARVKCRSRSCCCCRCHRRSFRINFITKQLGDGYKAQASTTNSGVQGGHPQSTRHEQMPLKFQRSDSDSPPDIQVFQGAEPRPSCTPGEYPGTRTTCSPVYGRQAGLSLKNG